MDRILTIFLLIFIHTSTACAELTKEYISNSVEDFNSRITATMNRTNFEECKSLGREFVADFNRAHKTFLDGQYLKATIAVLNIVENSSRKAYGTRVCPLNLIPRTPNAALYLRFYFQEQKSLFSTNQINSFISSSPNDGERSIIIHRCQSIAYDLSEICRKSGCSAYDKRIIAFANSIVDELNKKNMSVNRIALWLLAINSSISLDYFSSSHSGVLFSIHNQVLNLLNIVQPYLFNDIELSIPQKAQANLLKLILNEKHAGSICSVLLFDYYSTLDREHSPNKNEYLITYIDEHNQLFESLNGSLYNGNFYNTFCTIDKFELFDITVSHSNQVQSEIMKLML